MIYWWGMVQNGQAKHCIALMQQQDGGQFRPSYGDLCLRLLATNKISLLLMSATCAPGPFSAILNNLSIRRGDIKIVRGELSWSNIRIIRIPMKHGIHTAKDLLEIYSQKDVIPDENLVKSLIYSNLCNATLEVMKVVNEARGTPDGWRDPDSSLI